MTNKKLMLTSVSIIAALLSGCGGGGGGAAPAAVAANAVVNGVASKGPLNASKICAFAITGGIKGAALGQCATTTATGNYSIDLGTYRGPVLFEATGGSYIDEATGVSTPLSTPLHSVLLNAVGGNASIAVTALTELAYLNANAAVGGLTTTNVQTAVNGVQNNFGVPDIVNTMPVDALAVPATATAAEKGYALALAAVSQYQLSLGAGTSLAAAMTPLQNCLATPATACATVTPALNTALTTFTTAHSAAFTGVTLPAVATFGTPPVNPGGGNPASLPVVGTQMGGARQGVPINLTNTVSLFSGAGSRFVLGTGVNGIGTAATFRNPDAITTDGTSLYVAQDSLVRKIDIKTQNVTTLAGGANTVGGVDGIGVGASFGSRIGGVTTDGTNLYVSDSMNHKIRKIVIATGQVTTLAGPDVITCGTLCPSGQVDGIGNTARFSGPTGITTDGINVYVADTQNSVIRKIVISTGQVSTFAGGGPGVPQPIRTGFYFNGVGTLATFHLPTDITTDGTNLYVTDNYKFNIRKIVIASATVTTLAGPDDPSAANGPRGTVDGVGIAAQFGGTSHLGGWGQVSGITTDGINLYVSDSTSIRKVAISTGAVTTLVTSSLTSINGVGTALSYFSPACITTDGYSLYVTDVSNNSILKIQ